MKCYISVATVIHATIEELSEAVWSAPSAVWLCNIGDARKGVLCWVQLKAISQGPTGQASQS
jgi:hypothetical protein